MKSESKYTKPQISAAMNALGIGHADVNEPEAMARFVTAAVDHLGAAIYGSASTREDLDRWFNEGVPLLIEDSSWHDRALLLIGLAEDSIEGEGVDTFHEDDNDLPTPTLAVRGTKAGLHALWLLAKAASWRETNPAEALEMTSEAVELSREANGAIRTMEVRLSTDAE